jgi:hypothetical protein
VRSQWTLTRRLNASGGWWHGTTQVVRHHTFLRTTAFNPAAHLIPKCSHADVFKGPRQAAVAARPLPDGERAAIDPQLVENLALPDREIAEMIPGLEIDDDHRCEPHDCHRYRVRDPVAPEQRGPAPTLAQLSRAGSRKEETNERRHALTA